MDYLWGKALGFTCYKFGFVMDLRGMWILADFCGFFLVFGLNLFVSYNEVIYFSFIVCFIDGRLPIWNELNILSVDMQTAIR